MGGIRVIEKFGVKKPRQRILGICAICHQFVTINDKSAWIQDKEGNIVNLLRVHEECKLKR